MDFFEAQDRAKRNTKKLVFYYILAVTGIIASVYTVTLLLFHSQSAAEGGISLWYPGWLIAVTFMVLSTITAGTLYRVLQLRKGGSAVAEMLGGRKVDPSTINLQERKLLNVVEEMSIASGISVPDVYILDHEDSINAFAAGYSIHDAAVGVTRGTLEKLNRDELQGVIAHEFSHIFNGDMRFNIRLIGVLNGILLIHMLGMIVMRSVMYSGMRVRSNRDGKNGNGTIVIILFGLSLVVIGYIGMVFGRMIQAAISRQREYLADAAAVQYTRNPDGLAGALHKIASKETGSELKNGHAMEMSHLFFANSFKTMLDGLFATHPPLKERIKAIQPHFFEGESPPRANISCQFQNEHVAGRQSPAGKTPLGEHRALTPEVIIAAIGSVGSRNIQQAGRLLDSIPEELRRAVHEPLSAEALIFAMLYVSGNHADDEWMANHLRPDLLRETERLSGYLSSENRSWFLPLAELAVPALRGLSRKQYGQFRSTLLEGMKQTNRENLFLFALEKMVVHQLDAAFSKNKKPKVRYQNLQDITEELSVLLSALCYASGDEPQKSWQSAMAPLEKSVQKSMKFLDKVDCTLEAVDQALDALAVAANPVKKHIIRSVIFCITADQNITQDEAELTRAISEVLGVPVPLGGIAG